jgi:cohesin loading factor subunit SCC2
MWGHELANALRVLRGNLPEDDGVSALKRSTSTLYMKLRNVLSEVWTSRSADVFDVE